MKSDVRVKICGLTLPDHAEAAASSGVELVGLMFAERSRRHLSVEAARRVLEGLPPRTGSTVENLTLAGEGLWFRRCADVIGTLFARRRPLVVGVFADQPVSLMNSIAETLDLDLIQLSGNEPWETCLQLRRPAIKMLRAGDAASARELLGSVETGTAALCLLDADVPGEYGGTGTLANWRVAGEVARSLPIMLAGGLSPANVGAAVATVQPWAVDVSSGVERDGVKDVTLIREFVRAAKSAGVGVESHGR